MVGTTLRPLYHRDRPGAIVQEAGWATGPVWTGAKNLAPPGSIPGPSSLQSVAIPTELPGIYIYIHLFI
jgi:hypothetical protein